MRKQRVIRRIFMEWSTVERAIKTETDTGTEEKKKSREAWLVYVKDINCNIHHVKPSLLGLPATLWRTNDGVQNLQPTDFKCQMSPLIFRSKIIFWSRILPLKQKTFWQDSQFSGDTYSDILSQNQWYLLSHWLCNDLVVSPKWCQQIFKQYFASKVFPTSDQSWVILQTGWKGNPCLNRYISKWRTHGCSVPFCLFLPLLQGQSSALLLLLLQQLQVALLQIVPRPLNHPVEHVFRDLGFALTQLDQEFVS